MLVRLLDARISAWPLGNGVGGDRRIPDRRPFGFLIGFVLAESHGVGAIFRPVVNFFSAFRSRFFFPCSS